MKSFTLRLAHRVLVSMCGVAALATVGMTAAPTTAQTADSTAQTVRHFVVTGDNVYVRSGPASSYYPIERLQAGQVIEMIGEKFTWAKIRLDGPAFKNLFGYIKIPRDRPGDFEINDDARTVGSAREVPIFAPNLDTDYDAVSSWRTIGKLRPSAPLRIIEQTESETHRFVKVPLQRDATAWISKAFLIEASPQQVAAWKKSLTDTSTGNASLGTPEQAIPTTTRPPAVVVEHEVTVLPRVESSDPTETEPAADDTTIPVVGEETTTRVEIPTLDATTDTTTDTAAETTVDPATGPDTNRTTDSETTIDPAIERIDDGANLETSTETPEVEVGTDDGVLMDDPHIATPTAEERLDDLEGAFERLRSVPHEDAEVIPLRNLYEQLAADLRDDSPHVARFADARVTQLGIWADLQERRRNLLQIRRRVELETEETSAARVAVDSAGRYDAVGRLSASTIYDGHNLPRLLRLADPGTGRTVAYVRPNDQFDVVGLLGHLLGVSGTRAYDGGLRLNIIEPRRVDILTASTP